MQSSPYDLDLLTPADNAAFQAAYCGTVAYTHGSSRLALSARSKIVSRGRECGEEGVEDKRMVTDEGGRGGSLIISAVSELLMGR